MTILAIDLGTSAIKLLRADEHLRIQSIDRVASRGLDVQDWLDALRLNIANHGDGSEIDRIAITGQMHGLVTLETKGFGEGIPWTDQRGATIASTLNDDLGPETIARLGGPLASGFLGVSLAWLKANDPARWRRIRKVMLPKDALVHALTGRHLTDPTDAAGTGLFDVATGSWNTGIVDHIAIPHDWLPEIVPSGTDGGPLIQEIARECGLLPETRVIIAGGDAPVGTFGAGISRANEALLLLSSGAQLILPSPSFTPDGEGRWYTWPSVSTGFLHAGTLLNAGNAITWMRRTLVDSDYPGEEPTSLIALPHLIRERTPLRDAGLRGAILGLASETTSAEIDRAMMEGVAYAIRHAFDIMGENHDRPKSLRIGGGGTNISGWQQIITDVLDMTTRRIETPELTALGAAALASGKLPNPQIESAMKPDRSRSAQYDERYAIYRDALDATLSISHRIATLSRDESS